jgi:outer membrane lipoprotein-sorting protein
MKNSKYKMVRVFHFSFFILYCALLSGCALFGAPDRVPLRQATADELTALLAEREAAIHTMKGLFSAKITGGILPIGQRVEGTVFYQRPNALRLRGFNALGGELFEFVQLNDEYRLRLPSMGREVNGRSSEPEKMGQLARPFQLSVWAMSGILGTGAIAPHERVVLTEDDDRYRLDVFEESANNGDVAPIPVRRIWFDRRNLQVVREERVSAQGDVEATLQFDDFRPVGQPMSQSTSLNNEPADRQLLRPFKIVMKDGRGQGNVQVTFYEIIPNMPIKPSELGQV